MNINFTEKKIKDNEGQYNVYLEGPDWQNYLNNAENKEILKLQIPGFRKGHIPTQVAKKYLNHQKIAATASNKFLDDAYKIILSNPDKKYVPFNYQLVEVKITEVSNKKIAATFIFPLLPDIQNIDNWKSLKIDLNVKSTIDLTKTLKDQQNQLINQKTEIILVEDSKHKLKAQEIAVIDYEGSIDGKVFPGGSAKKFDLTIGGNQFIPGFEDQLIDMVVGTKKTVKVTFPKDYHAKDFAGKIATFHVYLHEIKTKKLPKFDDAFIQSLNLNDISTVKKWNDITTEKINQDILKDINEKKDEIILNALVTQIPIEISSKIIDIEFKQAKNAFYKRLEELKVPKEIMFAQMQQTEDQLLAQMKEDTINRLKLTIILSAIANLEKIAKDDSLYNEWLISTSKTSNITPEELSKKVPLSPEILVRIRNEVVWNMIKKQYIQ